MTSTFIRQAYLKDTFRIFFELLANPPITVKPSQNPIALVNMKKTKVILFNLAK